MSKIKRYIIVMAIGVLMNELLHAIANYFDLPVWLDVTGVALVSIVLEPTAGLLVGLINNFYLAIFEFGNSSLLYYAVSASVALIVGLNMKRDNKVRWQRVFSTVALVIAVSSLLSTILTVLISGGVSTARWEIYYHDIAVSWGAPSIVACFFGTFVVKVYDTVLSALIVWGIYMALPRSLNVYRG